MSHPICGVSCGSKFETNLKHFTNFILRNHFLGKILVVTLNIINTVYIFIKMYNNRYLQTNIVGEFHQIKNFKISAIA